MPAPCYLCKHSDLETVASRTRDREDVAVLRCGSCGLVQASKIISGLDSYYEEHYREDYQVVPAEEEKRVYDQDADRRLQAIREQVPQASSILDVGCGDGTFLMAAAEHYDRVAGVEPHRRTAKLLCQRGFDVRPSLWDFQDDPHFDLVCSFHVLEHVPDPVDFARQLRQAVGPHGCCFIEVPGVDDALLTLYDIPAFHQFYWQAAHLFCFAAPTLTEVLQRAGWQAPQVSGFNRYGLRNHLHWLNTSTPGSGNEFLSVITDDMDHAYRSRLVEQGIADTLWAILRP